MNTLKRVLSFVFAIALTMSLGMFVFAAEITDEDDISVYVLHHNVPDDGYDGPNLQYFSPYVTDYRFDSEPSYIQSNIFSLYNTLNQQVIPTYCTDIKVGALPDHRYRRLNLEDSTYAASAAGLLRAIILNGFYLANDPSITMEEHALRVEAKLQELGKACGVPDLTIGEAISGTQTAIWQAAHGSRLEYTDFVRTIYTTKMPSVTKYYNLCNEERENGHINYTVSTYGKVTVDTECDANINARIRAVYDYLLSLKPVAPVSKVVSISSFVELADPVFTLNTDGTYTVTVNTTVDVDMAQNDELTLTAVISDDYSTSTSLSDGKQDVTLSIDNVPASLIDNDVVLTIDGSQTVSEVFLYDAYGGRETAQSMIGMDASQLPVRAAVIATTDRILNFYKTTVVATGSDNYVRRPLEGITFDIYFAAFLDDYLSGNVALPEPEEFDHSTLAEYTVITDENGRASINFTQHGMPDGVYLVVEREHPAIKAPIDPFYVFIPTTAADGSGYEYEITVQPKNDVKGSVRIEKDINEIGKDSDSDDVYGKHTWIIGTNIPEDIANGKSFEISDTLDSRLDYIGNAKVNVETADGQIVAGTLTPDTDYTITVNDVDSLADGNPSDSFILNLTDAGMGKIHNTIGQNSFDDYMLRVYFDAQINANAKMGEAIPNQATLEYVNSVNFDFSVESDKPVISTGGAELLKVDAANNNRVLSGAVFEVYRKATADEVTAGAEGVTHISGVSAPVIKVAFYDNHTLQGDKVNSVASDENGSAAIYGLAYGTYYLLETKSPAGYNLLDKAVELTVDGTTHMDEKIVTVENVGGTVLPSTGGVGTTVFTFTGMLLVCASVVLFLNKRKNYSV